MDKIYQETVLGLMQTRSIDSYSELCRIADISRPSLYALLSGENPYRETVYKLAKALKVSPAELISREPEESNHENSTRY